MIDTLKNMYLTYYEQVLTWYDTMTYVQQFFTLFGVFMVIAVIVALYLVKKAAS